MKPITTKQFIIADRTRTLYFYIKNKQIIRVEGFVDSVMKESFSKQEKIIGVIKSCVHQTHYVTPGQYQYAQYQLEQMLKEIS